MSENKEKGLVLVKPHRIRDTETIGRVGGLMKRFGRLDLLDIVNHGEKGTLYKMKAADRILHETNPKKAQYQVKVEEGRIQVDYIVIDRLFNHFRLSTTQSGYGYELHYEPAEVNVLDLTSKATGEAFQMRQVVPSKNGFDPATMKEAEFGFTTYFYDYMSKLILRIFVNEQSKKIIPHVYSLSSHSEEQLNSIKEKLKQYLDNAGNVHQDGYFIGDVDFADFYSNMMGYENQPLIDKGTVGAKCGFQIQHELLNPPSEMKRDNKPSYNNNSGGNYQKPQQPQKSYGDYMKNIQNTKAYQDAKFDDTYI